MKNVCRLFRFMLQFGIDRFQILAASENTVQAAVGWPDEGQLGYDPEEERQEIVWDVQNLEFIDDALELLEIAFSQGCFDSDKLSVPEDDLFHLTGWERNKFNNALQDLLRIRVDMVDDKKNTDYFFVHF